MINVIMPQPSHYVPDGKVTRWYKKVGDHVEAGEPLPEIETIKALSDVEAPGTGTAVGILVPEGETVACETLLAEIEV